MTRPTHPAAARHQRLLTDLRTAFPGRDIQLAALPPEANADLPETASEVPQLEELMISSDGPGHYAVTLPDFDDPQPAFQLFFVNVNDMPGDGERLGTFSTAAEAVGAAIAHENAAPAVPGDSDLTESRQAATLRALDFPPTPGRVGPTGRTSGDLSVGHGQHPQRIDGAADRDR